MQGNEILLNMENHRSFTNGELISSLIELHRRDPNKKIADWCVHPISSACIGDLKQRICKLSHKHVLQTTHLLSKFQIYDVRMWSLVGSNIMRMLHKYNGSQLAFIMDLFDKEFINELGEEVDFKKANDEFFERIVALLPVHI